jgi:phage terminase large subunit-like protein
VSPGDRLIAAWQWWRRRARDEQRAPSGLWLVWLLLAGRGFGKTKTGAEEIARRMVARRGIRVALVAATFGDGRDTMVEGESGLLAVLERYYGIGSLSKAWNRSMGELVLPNGSRAKVYSAEKPRQLRGPQHHVAWCDELAWWQYPRETWDNLLFGLRLGKHPQVIVTTTPRPIPLVRELVAKPTCVVTRGRTLDNADNLPESYLAELLASYAGTRTGEQELDGLLLDDVEGARWNQELLRLARRPFPVPELDTVELAVDPAATKSDDSDAAGIAVVGRGPAPEGWAPSTSLLARTLRLPPEQRELVLNGPHLYVLHSEGVRRNPTETCERALELLDTWQADRVIFEANNGGEWLPAVLRGLDPAARYRLVTAHGSKLERAEPLARLYEQERVHHVGRHDDLEGEQVSYTGGKKEPSPNVLDATVYAALALLPSQPKRRRRAARKVA